jgi:hydrogenase-4 component F
MLPLLAAAAASGLRKPRPGTWLAIGGSSAAFLAACALPWQMQDGRLLLIDPLSAHIALLTAFIGMTSRWFSDDDTRFAPVLFLLLLAALLLAVLAGNLALTWFAMEAGTIAGAAALAMRRTESAVAAAWRFFVLQAVGLSLALFGTILVFRAMQPVLGAGLASLSWSAVADAAPRARGPLLTLAFVFLLSGYGTSAALVPLHTWLAKAEAEADAPTAALLGAAMPGVALALILRARALTVANPGSLAPGPLLIAFGLASLLLGAFSLWRQHDARSSLPFATIGQSGVAAFAFGIGGPAANLAGMLHLTLLALAKSAALRCVRSAFPPSRAGTLALAAGLAALAGVPPFGLFISLFLVASETARHLPWLLLPLGLGLAVGASALVARLIAVIAGSPAPGAGTPTPLVAALVPVWLALAVVMLLGLAMPGGVVAWLGRVAEAIR